MGTDNFAPYLLMNILVIFSPSAFPFFLVNGVCVRAFLFVCVKVHIYVWVYLHVCEHECRAPRLVMNLP